MPVPEQPAPPELPATRARRKPRPRKVRIAFAIVFALFLITWLPVLVMRWVNPATTAYMLETASGLPSGKQLQQTWVPYRRMSPAMRLAVVASEDQTFPSNHGFDVGAIRKAIKHNEQGGTIHGASTITQQVAKNLFLWPARSYFRKGVGAWFTILIDGTWPKRRVLEMYLNIAQFGPRTFGVEAAARHYFGKHASQLTRPEAALLAAALPDPDHLDPAHPSDYMRQRQAWILEQMRQLGSDYLDAI